MNIIITGVSRGIGLELTKIALEKGHNVLGIARSPEKSSELMKLKNEMDNLHLLKLDISSPDALEKIKGEVKSWSALDVLINNAGIYSNGQTMDEFERTFRTNTIAPFLLSLGLLDLLKKSDKPISVQITSQMGSITDNTSGGAYSYRASKTALNMLYKSLAIDEKWLISLLVHPGWVKTSMGGTEAPTMPRESAEGIWNVINDADIRRSGSFVNFRGQTLPW